MNKCIFVSVITKRRAKKRIKNSPKIACQTNDLYWNNIQWIGANQSFRRQFHTMKRYMHYWQNDDWLVWFFYIVMERVSSWKKTKKKLASIHIEVCEVNCSINLILTILVYAKYAISAANCVIAENKRETRRFNT